MAPLAFSLGAPADDVEARLTAVLHSPPADVGRRIDALAVNPESTIEDVFHVLPGHRLPGAWTSRESSAPWFFAATVVALGWAAARTQFRNFSEHRRRAVVCAVFSGTIGVGILIALQPRITALFDCEGGAARSMAGFLIGVGLIEELVKLLPVLWLIRNGRRLTRSAACLVGMASGLGFGVAEGIVHAGQFYNGVSDLDAYVARFASCPALHAIWTGSAAMAAAICAGVLSVPRGKWIYFVTVLSTVAVPAALHGLYDMALHERWEPAALAVALASLMWLARLIEASRAPAGEPCVALASAQ